MSSLVYKQGYYKYLHLPLDKAVYEFDKWISRKLLHLEYITYTYNEMLQHTETMDEIKSVYTDYICMKCYFMSSEPPPFVEERIHHMKIHAYESDVGIWNDMYNTSTECILEKIQEIDEEDCVQLKYDMYYLYDEDDAVASMEIHKESKTLEHFISIQYIVRVHHKHEDLNSLLRIERKYEKKYKIDNIHISLFPYMDILVSGNIEDISFNKVKVRILKKKYIVYLPIEMVNKINI